MEILTESAFRGVLSLFVDEASIAKYCRVNGVSLSVEQFAVVRKKVGEKLCLPNYCVEDGTESVGLWDYEPK